MVWDPTAGPLADFWASLSSPFKVNVSDMSANITANFNALQSNIYAGWTSWTPAVTSTGTAPNLGTGFASLGRFKVVGGDTCTYAASVTWGTTPSVGSGTYRFSIPVPWFSDGVAPLFPAQLVEGGVVDSFLGNVVTTTTIAFSRGDHTANQISATYPTAPVAGWILTYGGTYRCAT